MTAKKTPLPHSASRTLPRTQPVQGGRLAVDYANTADYSSSGQDALQSWQGLLSFLVAARVITPERKRTLLEWDQSFASATQALLRSAAKLRSAIREAFLAMANAGAVRQAAIDPINEILAVTEGHDQLAWQEGSWQVTFRAREERLEWLLAAIARSAAEIIAEGAQAPLRRCANPSCGFIFYDTSRTGRRRWCSMSACGNRSKVAAFAQRHSFHSREP